MGKNIELMGQGRFRRLFWFRRVWGRSAYSRFMGNLFIFMYGSFVIFIRLSLPSLDQRAVSLEAWNLCAKLLQSCATLCDPMNCGLPGSSVQEEYWMGCHSLLQGILVTQGSNPHLLCLWHWQEGSLPLAPPGKAPLPFYNAKGTGGYLCLRSLPDL